MMLTAAHDLLKPLNAESSDEFCNPMSAGAFLLADTIGGVIGIAVAPLIPIGTRYKIIFVTVLSVISFLITAFKYSSETIALVGVLMAAFAAGFGEATIISVSLNHKESAVSAYASGLGAAALLSSGAYLVMTFIFSTQVTLLLLMIVPFVIFLAFWFLIRTPKGVACEVSKAEPASISIESESAAKMSVMEKFRKLMIIAPATIIPIFTTSVLRCFINQGLLELVHSHDVSLKPDAQYRIFTTVANMGMFVTQSSVSCLQVQRLWLLPIIETFLMILILFQVLASLPNFYLLLVLSLANGMIGGAAIVNTYCRIRKETEPHLRPVHMEVAIFANELAAATAGFIAIPSHSAICSIITSLRNRK